MVESRQKQRCTVIALLDSVCLACLPAEKKTGATTMKKYCTTKYGTKYGSTLLDKLLKIYPTISIADPTTSSVKYHVLYLATCPICTHVQSTKVTIPMIAKTREGT